MRTVRLRNKRELVVKILEVLRSDTFLGKALILGYKVLLNREFERFEYLLKKGRVGEAGVMALVLAHSPYAYKLPNRKAPVRGGGSLCLWWRRSCLRGMWVRWRRRCAFGRRGMRRRFSSCWSFSPLKRVPGICGTPSCAWPGICPRTGGIRPVSPRLPMWGHPVRGRICVSRR